MVDHFAATDDGGVVLRLEPAEAEVLRSLLDELDVVLDDPEQAGPDVARRLQVAAHPDDPLAEDDFRAGPAATIDSARREALAAVLAAVEMNRREDGGVVAAIDPDDVDAWLACINHLRLILGTRLELESDTDLRRRRKRADDHTRMTIDLYEWLTFVLEELLDVLPEPPVTDV